MSCRRHCPRYQALVYARSDPRALCRQFGRHSIPIATLNPFLDNMRLDLHIASTPELRVETSLAKLSGDLDLRVRGTAARPAIVGRVNIAEGDVFFSGTKYRLERG